MLDRPAAAKPRRAAARVFGPQAGRLRRRPAGADRRGRAGATRGDLARRLPRLGRVRLRRGGARGRRRRATLLERRLARVEAVLHNQDNREHDLLDCDDYYQFEGGLAAAVELLAAARRRSSRRPLAGPNARASRALDEEIARVVRGRAAQPEMDRRRACATATRARSRWRPPSTTCSPSPRPPMPCATTISTRCYDAYLGDDDGARRSSRGTNPAALREIADALPRSPRPPACGAAAAATAPAAAALAPARSRRETDDAGSDHATPSTPTR